MDLNSSHLSFEKIADLVLGAPPDAETAEHLKTCPQCEFEAGRLGRLIEVMRTDQTEDAPAYAIAAILRSFDEQRTKEQTTQPAPLGRRIRAILRLDSAASEPSFGFRASDGGAEASRQLLFHVGDGTLDLRIQPDETGWIVSGQILGQLCDGRVELSGNGVSLAAEFDTHCEFALPAVPRGIYTLRLYTTELEIEVPNLAIA